MLTKSTVTLLGFVAVILIGAPALADKTVDDFESYNSGQIIGKRLGHQALASIR